MQATAIFVAEVFTVFCVNLLFLLLRLTRPVVSTQITPWVK